MSAWCHLRVLPDLGPGGCCSSCRMALDAPTFRVCWPLPFGLRSCLTPLLVPRSLEDSFSPPSRKPCIARSSWVRLGISPLLAQMLLKVLQLLKLVSTLINEGLHPLLLQLLGQLLQWMEARWLNTTGLVNRGRKGLLDPKLKLKLKLKGAGDL